VNVERIDYDEEADVLSIRLSDARPVRTETLDDLRLIDYSRDGGVVGMVFVSARGGVDLSGVPFAETIERLIRDRGLPFRVFA
jgi:uncharacterized protein YuzE